MDSSFRIGEYDRLQAKHEALVERLSPLAKHRAFPRKYAQPLPADSMTERLRRQVAELQASCASLSAENKTLKENNAQLANLLARLQIKAVTAGKQKATIAQVKDAFIKALEVENVKIGGEPYTEQELISPRRSRPYSKPRQICIWLCVRITKQSTPVIGKAFGGRDHTTVLHAEQKAESTMEAYPRLKRAANRVLATFAMVEEAQ